MRVPSELESHPGKRVTKGDMKVIAHHIDGFMEELWELLIIPDHVNIRDKDVQNARAITMDLMKRLGKGDRRVFKDPDDWECIDFK